MQIPSSFWQVNVGQIATVITIVGTLWQLHMQNVKRIKDEAKAREEETQKLTYVYTWINEYGDKLLSAQAKIEYISLWFEKNIMTPKDN